MKQISLPLLKRFSLLPLAVMALLTAVFAILEIRVSLAPPLLFPVLQTLFIFVAYATAAYLAAVNFRRTGSWEILLFGVALLIFGTSATLAGWLSPVGGINLVATIHNISALLGCVLLLIVAVFVGRSVSPRKEPGRLQVAIIIYGAALIFMSLLTVLALMNLMPSFFDASGPTTLRQIVYGAATALLGISTSWFIVLYRRSKADFLYWCCLGFTLIFIGFTAGLFIGKLSDPLSWVARIALYLSGLYLLVAGLVIRAEAKKKRTGVQEIIGQFLNQSRFNYGNLVESLTDGIISIDHLGRVLMWNHAAEKMFGYSTSEAVGSLLRSLIIPNECAESLETQVMSLPLRKNVQLEAETIELTAKRRNDEEFPVEISLSPSRLAAGRPAPAITTLVIRDVTERRHAEEALRESEERLSLAVQGTGMGTWDVDMRTGRAVWSDTHFEILGYPPSENGEATLEMWRSRVHPDDLEGVTRALETACATDSVYAPEHRIIRADNGEVRWLSVFGRFLRNDAGEAVRFVGIFFDNTERKRAEEALQQQTLELQRLTETLEERVKERTAELATLSSQLVSAQENERRRVSYDLHDNAWQALLAIRFDIDRLFSDREGINRAALEDKSKKVMAAILDAVGKIRSMQGDLWPYVLDDIGILATIDWYCREFEKDHPGITIEKKNDVNENEIPSSAKIVIYRILQETLSNVAKHSRASRVTLRLMKKDPRMEFTVEDNGIGFDPEETIVKRSPWGGLGLLSIKARTELSGGLFGVESVTGKGTTVRASWASDL